MINHNENGDENENQIKQIRHKQAQVQNEHKYTEYTEYEVSQYDAAYVLSNTSATFRAKFMEKLRNTEAKLRKIVAHEKYLNTNYKMCLSGMLQRPRWGAL